MSDFRLTGRRRHRIERKWGGKNILVLQVEESAPVTTNYNSHIECVTQTWWRDARIEDLSEHQP